MHAGEAELSEDDAIPANPDNKYGWEKLYAEHLIQAYTKKFGIITRIARFQTSFGPEGTWMGRREKAPAAICRKVAEAGDGGTIEVWGDGSAVRSYTYIDDLVDGILLLMHSDLASPVNLGSAEYVSVKELVNVVIRVSGKKINVKYVAGPVGVHFRNFSCKKMKSIGWQPRVSLEAGIRRTYDWISEQVFLNSLAQNQDKKENIKRITA